MLVVTQLPTWVVNSGGDVYPSALQSYNPLSPMTYTTFFKLRLGHDLSHDVPYSPDSLCLRCLL